ncbi:MULTISPECIES: response regulator transcription factor [unclassified Sphingomonas]|uniref:response regulator transcription factor n=1 Tax=unclassified Sphingomonas TaxID=196159 RepID=UPI0006FCE30A|nr:MULTISPECIES: response regulator transcription factor [unclassified Sphingomonas]KQM28344.1 XRE family transcriptional regulator [Sphingomonas sp. Leaf9]KQM45050.1 XRE family transcriptional regulator [Sphingomonas sp. Leaf11]
MKLLIVEDDRAFAAAMRAELETLSHDVTVAGTGPDALAAVEAGDFDAVVLDSMIPLLDGPTVVQRLRARGHRLPVLMLTALGHASDKVGGLEAGADDYVVKPAPAIEIDARLRALIRARGWRDDVVETLRAADITLQPAQHRAWRGERSLVLSNLEFKLLAELVRHAGGFVTRAMLIERVWGYDFEPATNIVDVQIRALRRKLTADGEDDPIVTKRGVGYSLRA